MPQTSTTRILSFAVLTAILSAEVHAGPARFWVSPSPTDPFWSGLEFSETLSIDLIADPLDTANSKATLYIWAQPATDSSGNYKQLQNMTLDVISTDPFIDFIDEEALLDNPLSRFSTIRDGASTFPNNQSLELKTLTPADFSQYGPDQIIGLQGLNLPGTGNPSDGIGPDCVANELCFETSQGSAWRIGSFGLQSIGMTGDVAIHLQIGAGGINHLSEADDTIESTSLTNVVFSATSQSPVYNAGPSGQRQTVNNHAPEVSTHNDDAPEVLIYISDQLTGDYTDSATVDGADFLAWQRGFGTSANLPNRRNGQTGTIGQGDLFVWETNYGKRLTSPSAVASVPEPKPASLLLVTAIICLTAFRRRLGRLLLMASCQFVLVFTVFSTSTSITHAELFWDGGAAGDSWRGSANWVGNPSKNTIDNERVFTFNASGVNSTQTINLFTNPTTTHGNPAIDMLRFQSTGPVTINPDGALALQMSEGAGNTDLVVAIGAGDVTINAGVNITRVNDWIHRGSNELIINGLLSLTDKPLSIDIRDGNGGRAAFRGGISGTGAITKLGDGMLTLAGSNTFSGGVTVEDGVLRVSIDANLGSGGVLLRNGKLRVLQSTIIDNDLDFGGGVRSFIDVPDVGASVTLSGILGGADAWSKTGPGRLNLTNNSNGFSAFVDINDGTLSTTTQSFSGGGVFIKPGTRFELFGSGSFDGEIRNGGSGSGSRTLAKTGSGRVTLDGSTSLFSGASIGTRIEGGELAGTSTRLKGPIITTGGSTAAVFLGTSSYSGGLSGPGKLIKEDSGTLMLTGSNSYTGSTIVRGGLLRGTSTQIRSMVTLENGAGLELSGASFNRGIIGNGNLTKISNDRTVLSGTASFNGNITVADGTLAINTSDVDQPIDVLNGATIEFTSSSGTWINTSPISGAGGLVKSGGSTLTLNNLTSTGSPSYSGPTLITEGILVIPNPDNLTSNINISSGASLWFSNSPDRAYSGTITHSGTGGIEKFGNGTLTLSASGSTAGSTIVNAGTLALTDGSNLVSNVNLNGSSTKLTINQLSAGSFTGTLSGSGSLEKSGQGTLVLAAGPNSYSGGTVVTEGRLEGATTTGALQDDFDLQSATTSLAINQNDNGTLTGVISGQGSLWKFGNGVLTLEGANTYSGGTFVQGGVLQGTTSSLKGPVTVSGGASLVFDQDFTNKFKFPISGDGEVVKNGPGTVELAWPHTFTYKGKTTINQGGLNIWPENFVSDVDIAAGAVLTLSHSPNFTYPGRLEGQGTFLKDGSGTLELTGQSNFMGTTLVQGGTLQGSTSSLKGTITLSTSTSVVFDQPVDGFTTGPISGDGTIVKRGAGILTLNAPHQYSPDGGLSIETGRVRVVASGLLADVTINAGASLDLQASVANPNQVYSHTISGNGEVIKSGVDIVAINGTQVYTGLTTVANGTLRVNGSIPGSAAVVLGATLGGNGTIGGNVTGPGRVAPGNSPGILTINGDFTQSADSVLEIEIKESETPGGGVAGVDFDQVQVGGTATLGGTIEVLPIDGYAPTLGDAVTVLTAGTVNTSVTPKISAPGLNGYNENSNPNADLGIKVSALPVVGPTSVVVEYVDKTSIEFTNGTTSTADWFLGTGWDLLRAPESFDETLVTGSLSFQSQQVDVSADALVHSLTVEDDDGGITVDVMNGNTLESVTGDVTINSGGAIELNGGTLKVATTQIVNVKKSGMLAGDGTIIGAVEVGTAAGSNDAMLSPGMSTTGMEVGTLDITGNYTQGTDGVFAIDITGGTTVNQDNNDFLDVSGTVALRGTLTIDASELGVTEASPGDVYEIINASGSLTGEFDDIVVTGRDGIFFEITYSDSGSIAAISDEIGAAATGSSFATLTFGLDGDANFDGVIDEIDARAFAAAILDFRKGFTFEDDSRASGIRLLAAFNFTDSVDTRIDLDDIAGFVEVYSASSNVSVASAYEALAVAFADAGINSTIPEPTTISLGFFVLLMALCQRRKLLS